MCNKLKLLHRINTLENQIDVLENTIKDELYKEFMKKLSEPIENERLRKENKRLRLQIKSMKEENNNGQRN